MILAERRERSKALKTGGRGCTRRAFPREIRKSRSQRHQAKAQVAQAGLAVRVSNLRGDCRKILVAMKNRSVLRQKWIGCIRGARGEVLLSEELTIQTGGDPIGGRVAGNAVEEENLRCEFRRCFSGGHFRIGDALNIAVVSFAGCVFPLGIEAVEKDCGRILRVLPQCRIGDTAAQGCGRERTLSGNTDIPNMDILADRFGLHFNNVLVHHVIGNDFPMGRIDDTQTGPPFFHPRLIYMKDTCSLKLSKGAHALLTWKGDILMADARYGRGTVVAVTDPWLYNEYTDGHKLPSNYQNFEAGKEFVRWLLQQK